MADNTLMHRIDIACALDSAKHISVLLQWIERARNMAETFDHLRRDEKFQQRCRENRWFPLPWEESESDALADLMTLQESCIRRVIAENESKAVIRAAA